MEKVKETTQPDYSGDTLEKLKRNRENLEHALEHGDLNEGWHQLSLYCLRRVGQEILRRYQRYEGEGT